jgi:hypothetical protein
LFFRPAGAQGFFRPAGVPGPNLQPYVQGVSTCAPNQAANREYPR